MRPDSPAVVTDAMASSDVTGCPSDRHWCGSAKLLLLVGGMLAGSACRNSQQGPTEEPKTNSAYWDNSPPVCAVDEVREYHCEELLPLRSALAAPPPFSNCPGSIEGHYGEIDPHPTVAAFDADYTAHIRRRMPPGHSCCYSWCTRIPLADAAQVDPQARCHEALSMRETYCFDEPEAGTNAPSAEPFSRCPAAIAPPPGVVFFAPKGALFDAGLTSTQRSRGLNQCCYAWCSIAPPNTGLQAPS